jgi:DNA-binding CsgD family transcriptional regulator
LSRDSLSKREQEVLDELRNGGRVATIAQKLSISPTTVRKHLQTIFWKLGVHSQAELVEHVRQYPETLSDVDAEARYWQANQRLGAEIDEMEAWRSQAEQRIIKAQEEGWVRGDTTPAEILEQLFSLLVGVSFQLVAISTRNGNKLKFASSTRTSRTFWCTTVSPRKNIQPDAAASCQSMVLSVPIQNR